MIKKIILSLVLCFLIISCGKKGDPEYKAFKIEAEIENTMVTNV